MSGTSSPVDSLTADVQRRMVLSISSIKEIEALSHVVTMALRATGQPESDSAEVARIIGLDQALTARVLGMANSAYHGGVRRITTVHQAIIRLGYRSIREILYAAATVDVLQRPSPLYGLAQGELWKLSVASALAAKAIAETVGYRDRDTAYIAGLLHDIGIAIIGRTVSKEEATAIRQLVTQENKVHFEAESIVLGYDHAQMGKLLLRKWELPENLTDAVAGHHAPFWCHQDPLTSVIHVADVLGLLSCNAWRPGWTYAADPAVVAGLGINTDSVTRIERGVIDNLSKVEASLGTRAQR